MNLFTPERLTMLAYVALAAFAVKTVANGLALRRQRRTRPFEKNLTQAATVLRGHLRTRMAGLQMIPDRSRLLRNVDLTSASSEEFERKLRLAAAHALQVDEDRSLLILARKQNGWLADALDRLLPASGRRLRVSDMHDTVEKTLGRRSQQWAGELWIPFFCAPLAGMAATMSGVMTTLRPLNGQGTQINAGSLSFSGLQDALLTTYIGIVIAVCGAFLLETLKRQTHRETDAMAREIESIGEMREKLYAAREHVRRFLQRGESV